MAPAAAIARLHTVFAASAFLTALIVGSALHYKRIVKNAVAQYPDEWFPSVSATIGDWYPERNLFQILIALTSGPRFALVVFQYYMHHSSASSLPTLVFLAGIVRTLSCGGWVYITSSDDHDVHDFMMILYIVCNLPWMVLGIATTPISRRSVRKKRKFIAGLFFVTIVPLVYFFIQHKVHRIPGAYTHYAFFEWGLIFFDVLYDSVSEQEFREAGLNISLSLPSVQSAKISPVDPIPIEQATSGTELTQAHNDIRHRNFYKPSSSISGDNNVIHVKVEGGHIADTASSSADRNQSSEEVIVKWRFLLSFLSDVYLSFIFWTLFTALIPTLFYFSVWELGIAGNELALLSVLSPMLLSLSSPYHYIFSGSSPTSGNSTSVLDFVRTHRGQAFFQLASLIGVLAYLVPSPGGRLGLVAIANIVAVMQQAVSWSGVIQGKSDVAYSSIVTGLGILLSSLLKQANRSNNPVWPFINHKAGGYNKTGLLLALVAIYEYYSRRHAVAHTDSRAKPQRQRGLLSGALPLGSLLFSVHELLSESSTLIAWSWTGYENRLPRGPVPHLHGSLTILAMAVGLYIAHLSATNSRFTKAISHPLWFLFGAGSSYVMYSYRNWTGYAGGLGVAVFLTSILPLVFWAAADAAVGGRQGRNRGFAIAKTYTTALAVYCILILLSIFTVAYAFVPGGIYLRERTDLVVFLRTILLLPVFNWLSSTPADLDRSRLLSLTVQCKSYIHSALAIISLLSVLTTLYRLPLAPAQPFKSGTRIFNTGIWTVHFGIDNEGHDSQRGIMNLIRDMELDVVGLLETDLHRTAFGHRDLSRLIVEEMGYNVDIGPGPNSHTWGATLLSKFPIISSKHHLLPSPHGELAPAIEAILDVYGTEVLVVVSHNGQEEDPLDRELQSTELAKIMAASTRPVIFLGYVVTKPWSPRPDPYGILVSEGNVHDIDVEDNDRWCEYIFYRGLYRTSYARVSRGIITDTETQIGQFVLPRHGHNVTDDSLEARYLRSRKEELPVEHVSLLLYP
ncbi:Frag1/DRAM/Sfk1 family-domain-containing protein [Gymnopilus junonius]|uniref:Frag1/DRAM/Sfk1 family-domain-containing protein n=1 Tax=Gymnopilus junonius TaxID=109634 RepID=A0A9P5NUW4_GYMJU|nr:Frag1/DRAM/Sfk1 family-domain-containing protein [Gymnopilus junonius]